MEVLCDWKDASVPAWTVLQALVDGGWRPGQAPEEHTVTSVRAWGVLKDAVASKSYLRCLLGLQELVGEGEGALAVRQLVSYYDYVLERGTVVGVDADLPAAAYRALRQLVDGQGAAGAPVAMAGMLDDDLPPMLVPPARLALQDRKRKRGPPAEGSEPVKKRPAAKQPKTVRAEDDRVSLLR